MVIRFAINTLTLLWYLGIGLLIYLGWTISDQRYLVPDSGTGYWLGIIGGSMMLMLLVYPVLKKNPRWKYLGSIKFWFRFHMFLGVIGPVLIIYHSGYSLGSLNSRVAFISMMIVAGSGLIGRYLYRSIHHGLYGGKIQFMDLYASSKEEGGDKLFDLVQNKLPDLVERIKLIENDLIHQRDGIKRSLWFYLSSRWKLRTIRKRILNHYTPSPLRRKILDRVWSLRSICNLGLNELLFSYWHLLHFPLFIMLVFSGITHVVVVHFY